MKHLRRWLVLSLMGFLIQSMVRAEEITLPYKGLGLNANYELAAGKAKSDPTILLLHGALAHNGMEIMSYLQKLFKERGYNTLAINLSLGLDKRHGMYDCKITHRHRNQDAVDEIGAWVDWLKTQGVQHVAVFGHSRGGAQVALSAVEHPSPLVQAYILLAPATQANNDPAEYQKRTNKLLSTTLNKAQKLVKAGKGSTVLNGVGIMQCNDTQATAESFVSYFADLDKLDTPTLLKKIAKPTLVFAGSADEVVSGLDKKVAPLADGKRIQFKLIEGADHFFRDLYADDVADSTAAFLNGLKF